MSVVSSEIKILRVLDKLRKKISDAEIELYRTEVREFVDIFEEELTANEADYDLTDQHSVLIPIENIRAVSCCKQEDISVGWASNVLSREKVGVFAFDGSMHDLGRHFSISIKVVNVGFWFQDYSRNYSGWGNEADVLLDADTKITRRIKSKEFEYKVASQRVSNIDSSDNRFIFYDESFNLLFTLSWDAESRRKYLELVKRHLMQILKRGIIPVAVFYTNSIDLYRTYNAKKGMKKEFISKIMDKAVMDTYLDVYQRSNLFYVKNRVLDQSELGIVAFYLKLGEKNVVRVEFPSELINQVELIHKVVLAQSVLGFGYPISLQRAHEWAVLTSQDRELIERETARLIGLPYVEMAYSKKLRSKRRPIV